MILVILFGVLSLLIMLSEISYHKGIREDVFLKKDSAYVRGIAAISIIFAHYIQSIHARGQNVGVLKFVEELGGIGVLVFFFISGYGIYKSTENNRCTADFLIKRVVSVLFPYWLMQIIFNCIKAGLGYYSEGGVKEFILSTTGVKGEHWFINVIVVLYIIFWISWKVSQTYGKMNLITLNVLLSLVMMVVFWLLQMPARWYNGLLLFSFGMFVAKKFRNEIFQRHPLLAVGSAILGFCVTGMAFYIFKGELWADGCKILAGVFLCTLIYIVFLKVEIKAGLITKAGEMSLYLYIVHMHIWPIVARFIDDVIVVFGVAFVLSILISYVFFLIYSKLMSKYRKI